MLNSPSGFLERILTLPLPPLIQAQRQQAGAGSASSRGGANANGGPAGRDMTLPQGDSWVQNSGHFQRPADGAAASPGGWSNPLMRG